MATCVLPPSSEFNYPFYKVMHRCAGHDAPENTLAAIKFGLDRHKNRAIEFDVQLSKDDIPVLFHDEELSRTSSGSGFLRNISMKSLSGLDAGSWYNESFTTECIPQLSEVVAFCKLNSIWMNIELKGNSEEMRCPNNERMYHVGATVAKFIASAFQEELSQPVIDYSKLPLFSSFSIAALCAARDFAKEIPRALLVLNDAGIPNIIEVLQSLEATAVHLSDQDIEDYDLAAIKKAGFKVLCYTVNCPERAQHLRELGVDAVCSDRFDVAS